MRRPRFFICNGKQASQKGEEGSWEEIWFVLCYLLHWVWKLGNDSRYCRFWLVYIDYDSRESGKMNTYCHFWVNPSPRQGHRRENFNCWYTFDGCDSWESKKTCLYCRFRVNISTMTVQSPENVLATAIFEWFSARIAVAWAGFAVFDCHQAV